ncbi:hypothetical protein X738_27165 [Mesorhizobium sp. LNHC209A00]|nr:hypothetical protein X738_27165 [Mesorhizobium sp. LNHC209A00]
MDLSCLLAGIVSLPTSPSDFAGLSEHGDVAGRKLGHLSADRLGHRRFGSRRYHAMMTGDDVEARLGLVGGGSELLVKNAGKGRTLRGCDQVPAGLAKIVHRQAFWRREAGDVDQHLDLVVHARLTDDDTAPGMADQDDRPLLGIDDALGCADIGGSELSGFCTATTLSPLASSKGMTLLQLEQSAKAPCTRTTVFFGTSAADAGAVAVRRTRFPERARKMR